jgi:uroporphyrinogen-III synthase
MADLSGLSVIITRPVAQADALIAVLEAHGAGVVRFPVLEIASLAPAALKVNLDSTPIAKANAFIFVSANAVEHGLAAIRLRGGFSSTQLQPQSAYAVGGATANALRQRGIDDVVTPSLGNDSEALLALTPLQSVIGQTIVVVKGESEAGGRTLLRTTLTERGAKVSELVCYTRRAVAASAAAVLALEAAMGKKVFSVLSVETLDSLNAHFVDERREDLLVSGIMVVPHERIALAARAAGWQQVEVVPMAPEAMCAALLALKPYILGGRKF